MNILIDMQHVISRQSTLEKTGLDKAVSIINSTPELILVSGFGLSETPDQYLAEKLDGYNAFLKRYCPTFQDAPNATMESLFARLNARAVRSSFEDMTEQEQSMVAPMYASMLKTSLLVLDREKQPAEKFFDLVRFHCDEMDFFTQIPLELAKYVFCNLDQIRNQSLRDFCGKVRSVLLKKDTSKKDVPLAQALYRRSLNAAFDLSYYLLLVLASSPDFLIDELRQDMWLLTGDVDLASLADAIYYDSAEYGSIEFKPRIGTEQLRHDSPYFRECDAMIAEASENRQQIFTRKLDHNDIVKKCLVAIKRCECEAVQLLGS